MPPTATPTPAGITIAITPPAGIISAPVSAVVNNALVITFSAAALLVLVFLIIGAFQWIVSGGDKEAVGKARSRITAALIGLAILALSFIVVQVIGQILGVNLMEFKFPFLGKQ